MKIKKEIVYVDMDGVIANFAKAYKQFYHPITNEFPQSNWGFFVNLEPIEGGIETVKNLMEHYDVWILTRPSYLNPLCYTEKRLWIEKYFGLDFCQKLIICSNKSLLKGDYLIDDCVEHGQSEFEGELLHFGVGNKFETWKDIWSYLMTQPIKESEIERKESKYKSVKERVESGYFDLETALKVYGVTKEEYNKFFKI